MDSLSIIGLMMGLVAIIGGNLLEGGHLGSLVNGPAFVIVCGGTFGAVLLQTPLVIFSHAMKMLKWVFVLPPIDERAQIQKIVGWSTLARREGLLGLEVFLERENDPFVRKGLQLLVDGNEPTVIRGILELDICTKNEFDKCAARMFEAMGGYSPTIGILGAVMGLIHVMENLADPAKLGSGIATAFVATIYGVGLANLFFIPIANKLKARAHDNNQARELLLDGILSIAEGENPKNIELKLAGYFFEE
jgi:chemotaxis protein MotA